MPATPAPASDPAWLTQLDGLLTGRTEPAGPDTLPGAQLVVTDPDGGEVFRAALARHRRVDPHTLWIRPIPAAAAEVDPATGLVVFDPAIARRRALHVRDAVRAGAHLQLSLDTDQVAHISPARGTELDILQQWDTWWTTLTHVDRAELESLTTDG